MLGKVLTITKNSAIVSVNKETISGIKDLINNDIEFLPYFLGFTFSFIVSFFTLKWFRNIVRDGKLIYFSIYCLLIGLFVLELLIKKS